MEQRRWRGSLVGPIILISLGIVFLLNNLGLLSWSVWEVILRLWPILLIAIGLDILLGRRWAWGSWLVAAIVLGLLIIAVGLFTTRPPTIAGQLTSEQISQPLGSARRAEVEIGFSAGTLRVGALPESANLLEGTVALSGGERVKRDFSGRGDTVHYELRSSGMQIRGFDRRQYEDKVWDLRLNRDVPMRLKIDTGIGTANLDLALLRLTELDVNTGIGQATLTLPGQGRLRAEVNGGIGETIIFIPVGMAARIKVDTGLGGIQVTVNYQRQGDVYLSPGYDTAENRVDLAVDGGMGKITIQESKGQ